MAKEKRPEKKSKTIQVVRYQLRREVFRIFMTFSCVAILAGTLVTLYFLLWLTMQSWVDDSITEGIKLNFNMIAEVGALNASEKASRDLLLLQIASSFITKFVNESPKTQRKSKFLQTYESRVVPSFTINKYESEFANFRPKYSSFYTDSQNMNRSDWSESQQTDFDQCVFAQYILQTLLKRDTSNEEQMIYIGFKSDSLCSHPAIKKDFFDPKQPLDKDLTCQQDDSNNNQPNSEKEENQLLNKKGDEIQSNLSTTSSTTSSYSVKCRPWFQYQEQNSEALTLGNLHKLELAQEDAKYPVGSTLCAPIHKNGQFYATLCKDIKSKQNQKQQLDRQQAASLNLDNQNNDLLNKFLNFPHIFQLKKSLFTQLFPDLTQQNEQVMLNSLNINKPIKSRVFDIQIKSGTFELPENNQFQEIANDSPNQQFWGNSTAILDKQIIQEKIDQNLEQIEDDLQNVKNNVEELIFEPHKFNSKGKRVIFLYEPLQIYSPSKKLAISQSAYHYGLFFEFDQIYEPIYNFIRLEYDRNLFTWTPLIVIFSIGYIVVCHLIIIYVSTQITSPIIKLTQRLNTNLKYFRALRKKVDFEEKSSRIVDLQVGLLQGYVQQNKEMNQLYMDVTSMARVLLVAIISSHSKFSYEVLFNLLSAAEVFQKMNDLRGTGTCYMILGCLFADQDQNLGSEMHSEADLVAKKKTQTQNFIYSNKYIEWAEKIQRQLIEACLKDTTKPGSKYFHAGLDGVREEQIILAFRQFSRGIISYNYFFLQISLKINEDSANEHQKSQLIKKMTRKVSNNLGLEHLNLLNYPEMRRKFSDNNLGFSKLELLNMQRGKSVMLSVKNRQSVVEIGALNYLIDCLQTLPDITLTSKQQAGHDKGGTSPRNNNNLGSSPFDNNQNLRKRKSAPTVQVSQTDLPAAPLPLMLNLGASQSGKNKSSKLIIEMTNKDSPEKEQGNRFQRHLSLTFRQSLGLKKIVDPGRDLIEKTSQFLQISHRNVDRKLVSAAEFIESKINVKDQIVDENSSYDEYGSSPEHNISALSSQISNQQNRHIQRYPLEKKQIEMQDLSSKLRREGLSDNSGEEILECSVRVPRPFDRKSQLYSNQRNLEERSEPWDITPLDDVTDPNNENLQGGFSQFSAIQVSRHGQSSNRLRRMEDEEIEKLQMKKMALLQDVFYDFRLYVSMLIIEIKILNLQNLPSVSSIAQLVSESVSSEQNLDSSRFKSEQSSSASFSSSMNVFNSNQGGESQNNLGEFSSEQSSQQNLFKQRRVEANMSSPIEVLRKFYISREDEFYKDDEAPKRRIQAELHEIAELADLYCHTKLKHSRQGSRLGLHKLHKGMLEQMLGYLQGLNEQFLEQNLEKALVFYHFSLTKGKHSWHHFAKKCLLRMYEILLQQYKAMPTDQIMQVEKMIKDRNNVANNKNTTMETILLTSASIQRESEQNQKAYHRQQSTQQDTKFIRSSTLKSTETMFISKRHKDEDVEPTPKNRKQNSPKDKSLTTKTINAKNSQNSPQRQKSVKISEASKIFDKLNWVKLMLGHYVVERRSLIFILDSSFNHMKELERCCQFIQDTFEDLSHQDTFGLICMSDQPHQINLEKVGQNRHIKRQILVDLNRRDDMELINKRVISIKNAINQAMDDQEQIVSESIRVNKSTQLVYSSPAKWLVIFLSSLRGLKSMDGIVNDPQTNVLVVCFTSECVEQDQVELIKEFIGTKSEGGLMVVRYQAIQDNYNVFSDQNSVPNEEKRNVSGKSFTQNISQTNINGREKEEDWFEYGNRVDMNLDEIMARIQAQISNYPSQNLPLITEEFVL